MQRETYKWWVVVMLWFVCFFNYADRQAIFSVFELLKSEMSLSDVQLGMLLGLLLLVLLREPTRARSTEIEQQEASHSDASKEGDAAIRRGRVSSVPGDQVLASGMLMSLRNMLSPIGELFANPMVRIL